MAESLSGIHHEVMYTYLTAMRDEVYAAYRAQASISDARARLRVLARIENADDGNRLVDEVDAEDDVTAAIQDLLTAQARLSLFLFPHGSAGARARTRASALRDRLDVRDDHAIGVREPRNSWMHLDEAIDRYLWEADPTDLVLRHYGAVSDSSNRRRVALQVDALNGTMALFGVKYDLHDLFTSVKDIGVRVDKAIETIEAA